MSSNEFRGFRISESCPKQDRIYVAKKKRIFIIFLLLLITITPLLLFGLWYGMESIVVFKNNKTLPNGERISHYLDESEYPIEPFAVGNTNGYIIYASSSNISQVFVKHLGFYIMDKSLYDIIIANHTYYAHLSSLVYMIQQFYPLGFDPSMTIYSDITTNLLYPYIQNQSITIVVGNYIGESSAFYTQSVKFKVSSGKYIIPMCELVFLMNDTSVYSVIGLWKNPLTKPSIALVDRGTYEYQIQSIQFNYEDSEKFHSVNKIEVNSIVLPPFLFLASKTWSINDIFTPVNDYSTTVGN